MGNGVNVFDFTVSLPDFLAGVVSDVTYSAILEKLKFDKIGEEALGSEIDSASGQLWSNLTDDFILATYPSFYLATKTWRTATVALRDSIGSDDGLAVGDLGYTDDTGSMFYVVSVDGVSASTWSSIGLTSGSTPSTGANTINGAVAITVIESDSLSATEDDYDPGGSWPDTNVLRLAADAGGTTLSGIDPSGGPPSQLILIVNTSSTDTLSITHDDATSAAANRFFNSNNASAAIRPNMSIWIWYDGTDSRWRTI